MSKLQALSGRIDWDQRPFMINKTAIERIIVANQNRDMIKRAKAKRGAPSVLVVAGREFRAPKRKQRWWTATQVQNLCLWVAFAAAFTGIAFVTASVVANYQAKAKVEEVWTADKNGNFIPMKHKGDK